jgi:predicted DNA-binding transcriptional regulator YafY
VRVSYRRWKQPTPIARTLEPLGLVLKAGNWYLIARSEGGDRTYRVDRVQELELLDEVFERPGDFDLAVFWQDYLDRFRRDMFSGEAVVRFSPEGMRRLVHLITPAVVQAARENAGEPDEDGWVRTVIPIESVRHAHGDLMRFGCEVEVLAPPELRDRMVASARAVLGLYGG